MRVGANRCCLYERYAQDVYRFALYLCGDPVYAEDIAAETFVRAWVTPGEIRAGTVKAYLFMPHEGDRKLE
ncbi:MAG: sigma factor [Anaerolineales bacterium]